MANKNFVVHNGLTVGALTIDAATGDINTSGNVNISGSVGVSQITKNDSSISINDSGTGSTVYIVVDGTTEHTVDADGVSLASGDRYAINGTSVLNATTLGTAVVNSSLTTVGNLTTLSVAGDTNIYGNLTVQGLSTLNGGTLTLGDTDTDNVVFGADINSSIIPNTDATYHLGGASKKWANVYATNLTGTIQTASQTNITAVGNLSSFSVAGVSSHFGVLYANAAVASTTTATGALVVLGGAGVSGNINAGNVIATGLTGTLLTASQPNITTLGGVTSIGASGATTITGILQTAAQTNVTSVGTLTSLGVGAITTTGTLALNAAGGLTTNQTTFLLANATATTVNIGGAATTLNIGATTGTLNLNNALITHAGVTTHAGILYANSATASTSATTGGLVVAGGVGIGGNLHIPSTYQIHVGSDIVATSFPTSAAQFNSNVNSYQQIVMQNTSAGTSASSDFVAVADTGTDAINYIDTGINSSAYSDVAYTIGGALDGYLYTNGGDLLVGTQTSAKGIKFHTGGTLSANLRARLNDTGFTVNTTTASTSTTSGALIVNGGVGIAGELYVGGNLHVSNIISTTSSTITVDDPLLYLTATASYPYNYDIGFYSDFTGGAGNIYQHTGLVRQESDGAWSLFSNVAEPAAGQVSLTNAIYDALNTGAHTVKGDPVTALINGGTSGVGNIGSSSAVWNTGYFTKVQGTLTTVSQPNITTLGGVTSIGASGTTTLTGILQTAAQTNVTSVGTLTALGVTGTVTAGAFSGPLTGTTAGTHTGAVVGNASTATALQTARAINGVSFDGTAAITVTAAAGTLSGATLASGVTASSLTSVGTLTALGVTGTVTAGAFTGPLTGNASTATALQTARAINGVSFDGTAAITVTANAATLSGVTLNSTVLASSLTSVGTLTGGAIGSGFTSISTAYTDAKVTSVNGSGGAITGLATTAGTLAQFGATTSAQLAGVISDETGSGALVFATSPTFTTQITTPVIVHSGTNGVGDIGGVGATFATVYATTFSGVSTTAKYADLAENYQADAEYASGTVVHFGGEFEVTACDTDGCTRVAGIVSTNPAHLMNTGLEGANVVALALTGRVPCRVQGTVRKGDLMVSAGNGRARAEANPKVGSVIGKALANSEGEATIEVVVGIR